MIKNLSLTVNHNSETSIEDIVMDYNDVSQGFIYNIKDLLCKSKEFDKILNKVELVHTDLTKFDFSRTKNRVFKKYIGKDLLIYVQGNSTELLCSFISKTNEESQVIWDIYNEVVEPNTDMVSYMYSYGIQGGQLIEKSSELEVEELEYISKSYYPYLDTGMMFDQFFTGDENIMLLAGKPGTGKSKILALALKHAISNPDNLPYNKVTEESSVESQFMMVVNVKGIDVLSLDEFWGRLEDLQPDFVFIDDLDHMLTSRDADVMTQDDANKNIFLDHFLTFTDGVEKNKTKFIITTNQSHDNIDTALLRKGRLFDLLEFRELTFDESKVIWEENELDVEDFEELFDNDAILPADLGSEINKRLNPRIKTATESYLKEDGISKVETASIQKRMSL